MAESEGNTASDTMIITIKSTKEEFDIDVNVNTRAQELKVEAAKQFGCAVDQICLVFEGRMLKDNEQLDQCGITDGRIVYVVIGRPCSTPGAAQSDASQSQSNIDASHSGPGFGQTGMGSIQGMNGLGLSPGNLRDWQKRIQKELLNKPGMLLQVMENPFVQQLMSNPDVMRKIVTENPLMKDTLEKNPEIAQHLNDPEVMNQTAEIAKNPAMFVQEVRRAQNASRRSFEIPTTVNVMQPFYRDLCETSMNAAQENMGFNTMGSFLSSPPGMGENSSDLNVMMQQTLQNPYMMQSLQNMMQAPYMQSMLQSMAANPQIAQQIVADSPLFADNEGSTETYQAQLPAMMQQLRNPEVQSAISNPRVMDAFLQIQQGMQALKEEVPEIASGMKAQGAKETGTNELSRSNSSSPENPTSTAATSTLPGATGSSGRPSHSTEGTGGQQAFNHMMCQLTDTIGQGHISPEQKYASQLDNLADMGFGNRQENLKALIATVGNLPDAIEQLCQQR